MEGKNGEKGKVKCKKMQQGKQPANERQRMVRLCTQLQTHGGA